MTQYSLQIRATLQARNLDSATAKLEQIKEKVERFAECEEVELVGQGKQDREPAGAD